MDNTTGTAWRIAEMSADIEGDTRVAILVQIRQNSSGIVRAYSDVATLKAGEVHPLTFIWVDGNFSCDCNRVDFFARAGGEEVEDDADPVPCTSGGYAVRLVNPVDGLAYYSEF